MAAVRKTEEQIANEIINGNYGWGTGDERKNKLAAAGYDYGAVQAIVNDKIYGANSDSAQPAKTAAPKNEAQTAADSYAKLLDEHYSKMASVLQEEQRAAEKAAQAKINQGVKSLEAQKPVLNQQFRDGAQQSYIQYMQSKKALPQALAAQGLSGGLSESSLVDLEANYGENVAALKRSHNQQVADLNAAIENLKATGDISLAESAGSYAQRLNSLYQQQEADRLSQQMAAVAAAEAAAKPKLSLAQAQSLLNEGIDSPEARYAYKYYTGADYVSPLDALTQKERLWVQKVNDDWKYIGPGEEAAGREKEQVIAEALYDAMGYNQNTADGQRGTGYLTWDEAQRIANYFGFSLGL